MDQTMKIYLVGGAVRDKLLNYPSTENDWVVVGGSPQEMIDQGYRPVGQNFPVFIDPKSGEEYALARTERKSAHGYQGFTFHTDPSISLEDDLMRRDLTINAMAEDANGVIIDPYGGQQDLQANYCVMSPTLLPKIHYAFCELHALLPDIIT